MAVLVGLCALPGAAGAAGPGGAQYGVAAPSVTSWACRTVCVDAHAARVGGLLRLRGAALRGVATVTFLGGRGGRDDVVARALETSPRSLVVQVPPRAVSGPVRPAGGRASRRPVRIAAPATGAAEPVTDLAALPHAFPVAGAYTYGAAEAAFGAGRAGHTHQGQDVLAPCGTPLRAALAGVVRFSAFEEDAGHYLVVDAEGTDIDYVYMHLTAPASVARGAAVGVGQTVGAVGTSGRSSGCHLHLELWSGPGWYEGGAPFDPLPTLRAWEGATRR